MNIQKHFNLKRFYNYLQYDLILNGRTYLYFSIGLFMTLFFIIFFTISTASPRLEFVKQYYIPIFFFTYLIGGVMAIGTSFPAFRNANSTINYLLLPVSDLEKFLVQFSIRIIGFTLLFFPLYWVVFKLAYSTYNLFEWKDPIQIESFGIFSGFHYVVTTLDRFVAGFSIFSVTTFLFAGATYFKKYAVFKTMLTFSLFTIVLFVFMVLLSHLFLPDMVKGFDIRILNRKINDDLVSFQLYASIFGIGTSLFLLPLAYFKLKEKEI